MNATTASSSLLRQIATCIQRAGAAAFLVTMLSSCSVLPEPVEDPTRYYLLASDAPATAASPAAPASDQGRALNVALRVVELPGYLRSHRTMVVRNGVNEIRYQDYARWAEPLDTAVHRIIRDRLLASAQVAIAEVAPLSPNVSRDYDISVRVSRCEGAVNESGQTVARFQAVYEIADRRNEGKIIVRKQFEPPAPSWDGSNYGQLAELLSEAVAKLGDQILTDLPK